MVIASQLRPGMVLRIEGQIYKVLESEYKAGGGQASGAINCKLQNALSGRMRELHFRAAEQLQDLELERQTMDFLYSDPDSCTFMNPQSFEQVEVPSTAVGPAERFLQPGMQVQVEFYDGRPISIAFPEIVEARIAATAPPIHSGQDNTWKEATLENGVVIQVPLFIGPGELVRVEVRMARYVERARLERKRGA